MRSADHLVYLHRSILDITMGVYRSRLHDIRVLYLRQRVSHSPNCKTFLSSDISLTISSGELACEQDIHRPNRALPRSRRLPLQSDVFQLLCRKGRHAGSRTCRNTCGYAFLIYLAMVCPYRT